jgi:membrane protein YqaA with SNARE-associated domain
MKQKINKDKNQIDKENLKREGLVKKTSNGFTNIDGSIRWKKLLFRTLIGIVFVIAILLAYEHFFEVGGISDDSIAKRLYERMGTSGVFLFVLIVDTFIVPMTVDVMYPLVVAWSPIKIMIVLGTASFFGGIIGYWIGRLLSRIKFIDRHVDKIVGSHKAFIDDHGSWAIVLAALSPLPYSTICWAAGVVEVDNRKIILACLARYARMLIYYYIFIGGLSIIS